MCRARVGVFGVLWVPLAVLPTEVPLSGDISPRTSQERTSVLDQSISSFHVTRTPMVGAVAELITRGVPVSLEQIPSDPKRDLYQNEAGRIAYRRHTFSVDIAAGTVRDVLEAFVKADPSYMYSYDKDNEMVFIFPQTGSILNWEVSSLSVENLPLQQLFLGTDGTTNDVLGFKTHGLTFVPGRGNLSWLATPVTLSLQGASIQTCLARICKAFGLSDSAHTDEFGARRLCYNITRTVERKALCFTFASAPTPVRKLPTASRPVSP
jgi:hypothetical protein